MESPNSIETIIDQAATQVGSVLATDASQDLANVKADVAKDTANVEAEAAKVESEYTQHVLVLKGVFSTERDHMIAALLNQSRQLQAKAAELEMHKTMIAVSGLLGLAVGVAIMALLHR